MDFNEKLSQFIKRIETIKDTIQTEEATKTAIIMPFFALLGYDVFNPNEFAPEFVADVGIKRGEKVDYAILQDGEPVIIIEAKAVNRNLEKHDSQLFRYFATTPAKIAILTNGLRYRFYTDLENQNRMDARPFLDFSLLNIRDAQIEELKKFQKESFNVAKISDSASLLKYQEEFKKILSEQFQSPSDSFVRFFLQDVYQGIKTQSVIDRFRPILKKSMQEFISETMNDKIKNALFDAPAPAEQREPQEEPAAACALQPTELEMDAYYRLKNMFQNYVSLEDITYKKNDSYFAILHQGNSRKWICRIIATGNQIVIVMPDKEKKEVRCSIANLFELGNYSRYMISVIGRYTPLLQPLDDPDPKMYQIVKKRRFPKVKRSQE